MWRAADQKHIYKLEWPNCKKRRKRGLICTVQRDRQKAKLQGRQQLAVPILTWEMQTPLGNANPFGKCKPLWEKAACPYNFPIMCHSIPQPHSFLPT